MSENILLCGNRSFVANGLHEKLVRAGFKVDCFSRGEEERNGDLVTGDVYNIVSNIYLGEKYDIVLNFIVLKNEGVDENLRYIKGLVQFCRNKRTKQLIHISSIMVYNNNEHVVNEETAIEEDSDKSGYGAIKIGVDRYLQSLNDLPFKISFIRPGYVLAENRQIPYLKWLPFGLVLIKGGRKSILPIVKREDFHQAIVNMLKQEIAEKVYLFVPSENKTKHEYAKGKYNFKYLFLYKWPILGIARAFMILGILSKSFLVRVEGMYIETKYDSTKTERLLKIRF